MNGKEMFRDIRELPYSLARAQDDITAAYTASMRRAETAIENSACALARLARPI